MGDTPRTPQRQAQCATGENVLLLRDRIFANWPPSRSFTAHMSFERRNLAELAKAVVQAERAGHHVRAFGNRWSMSDAVRATDGGVGAPARAMIETDHLGQAWFNFNDTTGWASNEATRSSDAFNSYTKPGRATSSCIAMNTVVTAGHHTLYVAFVWKSARFPTTRTDSTIREGMR